MKASDASTTAKKHPGRLARLTLPLLILCGLLVATEYVARQADREAHTQRHQQLLQQASSVRVALESELNAIAFLANGIESYIVARKGDIDPAEIEPMLALLFERGRHFRNIGIAPDNELRYIYPLAGNEAAVGLRYEDNPKQWPAVLDIMLSGRPVLAGPLDLVQGGQALIYRSPIYIGGTYWGLLSTVIDSANVLEITAPLANNPALRFALRHKQPTQAGEQVFIGEPETFENPPILLDITVPGGQWQLAVEPTQAAASSSSDIRIAGYLLAALAFLLSGLALRYLLQRTQLAQMEIAVEDSSENLLRTTRMLRSVLDAATRFSIIATDRQGTITLFNRGAELMLGYDAAEMIGVLTPAVLHLPAEVEARSAELSRALGRPIKGFNVFIEHAELAGFETREWTYRHKDGHCIPVALTVTALRDQRNQITGYLGIAEDVSDRKRTQRLKDEFIATVSHELRTPLTAISGALGLVASGKLGELTEPMSKMLLAAIRNGKRLERLINDLLDMEKLAAGKLRLDLVTQPLRPVVEQAVRDNQAYADQFDVTLELLPGPEAIADIDANRLQQVLANLLSNAAKFSPHGARVEISLDPQTDRARICVTDHGPGIPAAFRDRIFEKFSQSDASDTRQRGGTGLGLAISRELVERMGGTIGFDSTEGLGASFRVEFPIQPEASRS